MRMMAQVVFSGDRGNAAIRDGTLGPALQQIGERWKPEAMYFTAFGGNRTAFFIFDMEDSSQMPPFAEPLFQMGADVLLAPVMTRDDLQKGLSQL
ncbi:MAG: hypothetical protein JWO62_2933 [Acidimicrobiaceae bacterium]|jgi:hypothetical protein|nr:hypothetical protein [Acidimicrobiaceae bacterium]